MTTKLAFNQIGSMFVDITNEGASPSASASDNTTYIQAALTKGGDIYIPEGTYDFDAQLSLVSGTTIYCEKGAILNYTNSAVEDGIVASSKSNIAIYNLEMTGSGVASGFSNIKLTNCTNVLFDNCDISKAGAHAIFLDSCVGIKTRHCLLHNNYFYGIEDRDGISNRHHKNRCYENGETGVATSTGGRGINVWRGTDIEVDGNSIKDNTEYGFRFYSEAADSSDTTGCNLHHNYFEDNDANDILLYDEGGTGLLERLIVDSNIVKRTTVPTLGTSIDIQGYRIHVRNTHHHHEGTHANYTAFNLFQVQDSTVIGCSAYNVNAGLSASSTDNTEIDNFQGLLVAKAMTAITGEGVTLRNSRFTHGGVGTSDEAINNSNATGKNYYVGNTFDGFHTGIRLGNEAVSVKGNTTVNSTFAGIRMTTSTISNKEFSHNSWDIAAPAELGTLQRTSDTLGRSVITFNGIPANLTWEVGDVSYNTIPIAGGTIGQVCTVAGTPGTWKAFGAISA